MGFRSSSSPLLPASLKSPSQAGQSVRAINTKEPTLLYLQHAGYLYKQLASIIKNKRNEKNLCFPPSLGQALVGTPPLSCHAQKRNSKIKNTTGVERGVRQKMREGSAIFTLEFYRQLSRSIPIPILAQKVRGGRSKGQRLSV